MYHIAQVNIGRVRAPVEDPMMSRFTQRLDEINAIADRAPGFVWRLQTSAGNATYFRPYPEDDRILLNMSVWETVEALQHYVYHTVHAELLRHRHEWFERFAGTYAALWWVPAGHIPDRRGAQTAGIPGRARTDAVRLYLQGSFSAGRGVPAQYRLGVVRAVSGDLTLLN